MGAGGAHRLGKWRARFHAFGDLRQNRFHLSFTVIIAHQLEGLHNGYARGEHGRQLPSQNRNIFTFHAMG
ncbi:Uncharacterised protein [Vibrio cholerae]|nr:Uncharacterised protein [Vibrio cholerae]CSC48795.1 Uncharacterised protein [Vibrio cholerae]CSC49120.1 Uncharacterised protein [Vibrio cholerae]CSC73373.1 Uncharacterised protein [Vibrio cholerae]